MTLELINKRDCKCFFQRRKDGDSIRRETKHTSLHIQVYESAGCRAAIGGAAPRRPAMFGTPSVMKTAPSPSAQPRIARGRQSNPFMSTACNFP